MTYSDLPSRQKSQRLINRLKSKQSQQQFQQYKQRAKNITNINELLPGLNDISDAFEALPLDLVKYSTLLKEIDAKCINTVPQINFLIEKYIENLHEPPVVNEQSKEQISGSKENAKADESKTIEEAKAKKTQLEFKRLNLIKEKINEIIPCLEEKMHVTSVASELLNRHMFRINNDYKLIINNNEIPEYIRIGPLNHPAMIMDTSTATSNSSGDRSAQSQRSESRREALAAKKANKDDVLEDGNGKKKRVREATPSDTFKVASVGPTPATNSGGFSSGSGSGSNGSKKRPRKEAHDDIQRVSAPASAGAVGTMGPGAFNAKKKNKPKKEEETGKNGHGNSSDTEARNSNDHKFQVSQPAKSGGSNEPTYCYCNQVSFGEMVGCDGDDCKREWFHLPCIGFKNPPKGKWYCDDCLIKMKKFRKV